RERYVGACSRKFFVGKQMTEEQIKAAFENGILKITVPKPEPEPVIEEPKKTISIEG
ncbi:MAG: Hsp20 family protein, partial [Lachnospiraceae bacterium]|nr:Hsp20 family protein [Lachnospiraceae bacterium]